MVVRRDEKEPLAGLFWATSRPGTGGMVAPHSRKGGREALQHKNPCALAAGCQGCPWVDFRDYEQCGLILARCTTARNV